VSFSHQLELRRTFILAIDEIAIATLCHYTSEPTRYLSQLDRLDREVFGHRQQKEGSVTWVQFNRLKKRRLE
jgi:hypothetical protein